MPSPTSGVASGSTATRYSPGNQNPNIVGMANAATRGGERDEAAPGRPRGRVGVAGEEGAGGRDREPKPGEGGRRGEAAGGRPPAGALREREREQRRPRQHRSGGELGVHRRRVGKHRR